MRTKPKKTPIPNYKIGSIISRGKGYIRAVIINDRPLERVGEPGFFRCADRKTGHVFPRSHHEKQLHLWDYEIVAQWDEEQLATWIRRKGVSEGRKKKRRRRKTMDEQIERLRRKGSKRSKKRKLKRMLRRKVKRTK